MPPKVSDNTTHRRGISRSHRRSGGTLKKGRRGGRSKSIPQEDSPARSQDREIIPPPEDDMVDPDSQGEDTDGIDVSVDANADDFPGSDGEEGEVDDASPGRQSVSTDRSRSRSGSESSSDLESEDKVYLTKRKIDKKMRKDPRFR